MSHLSAEQLTGRVRTHVLDLPEPACTLHPAVAPAFLTLRAAASRVGIDLTPVSSFRSFQQQLTIWNDKFHGRRPLLDQRGRSLERAALSDDETVAAILLWSALPGASRHHWGTEIDVIDRGALPSDYRVQLIPEEYAPGGVFERLGAWLPRHCDEHGFFLPYDRDRGGVRPEAWHLSFASIAQPALAALSLEVLAGALDDDKLAGAAAVHRRLTDIHARYVCAVAQPSTTALSATVNPAAKPS
ncbi:MAG TPA: M15 family metallopeptidase [Steroidobacteraceae bacterium]|jgi:LAS superfamily LD-carboxypeptidase LdcB